MKQSCAILTLVILSFFFVAPIFGQKKCDGYVLKNCEPYDQPFKYSGQSKNGLFELGQKSLLKISVYDGFEYRVSLCSEKNLKGIFFRLREDNTNKTIIYDSSVEEDSYLEKMFYVNETKNLYIEVVVPEGDTPPEEQSYKERFGCVGVLLEYNKRVGMGFE